MALFGSILLLTANAAIADVVTPPPAEVCNTTLPAGYTGLTFCEFTSKEEYTTFWQDYGGVQSFTWASDLDAADTTSKYTFFKTDSYGGGAFGLEMVMPAGELSQNYQGIIPEIGYWNSGVPGGAARMIVKFSEGYQVNPDLVPGHYQILLTNWGTNGNHIYAVVQNRTSGGPNGLYLAHGNYTGAAGTVGYSYIGNPATMLFDGQVHTWALTTRRTGTNNKDVNVWLSKDGVVVFSDTLVRNSGTTPYAYRYSDYMESYGGPFGNGQTIPATQSWRLYQVAVKPLGDIDTP
jgi:hypothetical protein